MNTEETQTEKILPEAEKIEATETPAAEVQETMSEDNNPAKPKKRVTKSVVFNLDEFDLLEQILDERKKSGRTADWNAFLRQCIEFTINNQPNWEFAVPAHLKNKIHLA